MRRTCPKCKFEDSWPVLTKMFDCGECGHRFYDYIRPSWEEYFMHLAVIANTRSTCDRRRVGCVIVDRYKQIVSTGYNGSAPGAAHCDDVGHLMHNGHCVRTIHGEANAVAQAATQGKSTRDSIAFVTTHPCPVCLMLLASAGITRVVHLEAYHHEEDSVSYILAEDAAITIKKYDGRCLWKEGVER